MRTKKPLKSRLKHTAFENNPEKFPSTEIGEHTAVDIHYSQTVH